MHPTTTSASPVQMVTPVRITTPSTPPSHPAVTTLRPARIPAPDRAAADRAAAVEAGPSAAAEEPGPPAATAGPGSSAAAADQRGQDRARTRSGRARRLAAQATTIRTAPIANTISGKGRQNPSRSRTRSPRWPGCLPHRGSAHGLIAPAASSYFAKVLDLPAGLQAKVIDGDLRMWLQAPPWTVIVLDYRGAPYVRFSPAGVDVNHNSSMYYLNQTPVASFRRRILLTGHRRRRPRRRPRPMSPTAAVPARGAAVAKDSLYQFGVDLSVPPRTGLSEHERHRARPTAARRALVDVHQPAPHKLFPRLLVSATPETSTSRPRRRARPRPVLTVSEACERQRHEPLAA